MLIRSLAAIAAITCVSLVSGTGAFAQDDAQRERGRPGGRFGGPGGPPGGGMFGGGMGANSDALMLGLLRSDAVRQELKIMPDQETALQKLAERQRDGQRPDFDIRNASDEDRQKFFEKMRADMAKRSTEAKEQVEVILLPAQLERLEQIVIRAQGALSLMDPETAKKVGLTSEQTEKLKAEAQAHGESARGKIFEAFRSGDREAAQEKMAAMRKELDAKLTNVLTAEQKAEFEKLKGEPFDVPDMSQFGRGGDRGGRGGDRGDRGGDRGDRGDRGGDRERPDAE